MTLKEAVLKCLDENEKPIGYLQVLEGIKTKSYFNFENIQNPETAVGSILGTFIRMGDVRVRRIRENRRYLYYLSKNEHFIINDLETEILNNSDTEVLIDDSEIKSTEVESLINLSNNIERTYQQEVTYQEKDLHMLLCTFLAPEKTILAENQIFSKTINHSETPRDKRLIWSSPDIIGVKFSGASLKNKFLKKYYAQDFFELYSFELKREINNDSQLKEGYFQAVSNSSWSNFGYLVALSFDKRLMSEMNRLNQSFGIGFIELNANPFESKKLFEAKFRDLDLITIDKLMSNPIVAAFFEGYSNVVGARESTHGMFLENFINFCDPTLKNEQEIENYCRSKNIPYDDSYSTTNS